MVSQKTDAFFFVLLWQKEGFCPNCSIGGMIKVDVADPRQAGQMTNLTMHSGVNLEEMPCVSVELGKKLNLLQCTISQISIDNSEYSDFDMLSYLVHSGTGMLTNSLHCRAECGTRSMPKAEGWTKRYFPTGQSRLTTNQDLTIQKIQKIII